jgi:hypothetical protein
MTEKEKLHLAISKWKRLGWIPYCPREVRKYISFIPWYMPYKLMERNYT